MVKKKPRKIRNSEAYERSCRAKQKKHEAHIMKIAQRLPAIIRSKHAGTMCVHDLHQAWIMFVEDGALKPNEGRQGDYSRQDLIKEALQWAITHGLLQKSATSMTEVVLSVLHQVTPLSPQTLRMMSIERYEDELLRIAGRHYANLRLWGEAV